MNPVDFDKWIKANADLSVSKEDAEEVIKEAVRNDLIEAMETCYESVLPPPYVTPGTEYAARKAINILTDEVAERVCAYVSLLESHNAVLREYAPSTVVIKGCRAAIQTHGDVIQKLWDEINT